MHCSFQNEREIIHHYGIFWRVWGMKLFLWLGRQGIFLEKDCCVLYWGNCFGVGTFITFEGEIAP